MPNYSLTFKGDELSHHGIDGQKWGVRNGPPYPLDSGDHSKAELRAMRKNNRKNYKIVKRRTWLGKRKVHINALKNESLSSQIVDKLNTSKITKENVSQTVDEIVRDCLGKYADKPIYKKTLGVVTDIGLDKYGGAHYIGTATDILKSAIYTYLANSGDYEFLK